MTKLITLAALLTACSLETTGETYAEAGGATYETTAGGATAAATTTAQGGSTVTVAGGSSAVQTTTAAGGATTAMTTAKATGGAPSAGGTSSVGGATGTGGTSVANTYTIIGCPGNCREMNLTDQERGVVPTCNLRCGITGTVENYAYLFGFRAHDCMAGRALIPLTGKQAEQWDYSPVCAD